MRRLLLLGGLIYGLILVSLTMRSGELLALAIPLVVYLGAGLLYEPQEPQLTVARSLSTDRVSPGTPVTVKLSITNEGPSLECVLLEDLLPSELDLVEGESRVLTPLARGAVVELAYTVSGLRGSYHFSDAQVTASDRFGLFRRRVIISAPGRLLVLPRVLKLQRIPIRPRRTRVYSGLIPARQGGAGVEFFEVRAYQPGDPMRWINWRANARHPGAFFANAFEQERVADVGLILDVRRRSNVWSSGDSLFEHAVEATAALAESFLNDGNRVGLLMYGGFVDWTFPGYGKVQRERILQALARAELGDSLVFDKLEHLPTRLFPAHSQLVLISPLFEDDVQMLVRLRARGYQLLVISPDPVDFEAKRLRRKPSVELAARIARLERGLLIRWLWQAGIRVLDWQVDAPFDQVAHASLGRVPLWYRAVGVSP
ncbi:MAG: hypothetical protein MAG451_02492 [Anaerolineales bacterium]|nr:hypothetical protein [Anaerolineales bacterium]